MIFRICALAVVLVVSACARKPRGGGRRPRHSRCADRHDEFCAARCNLRWQFAPAKIAYVGDDEERTGWIGEDHAGAAAQRRHGARPA